MDGEAAGGIGEVDAAAQLRPRLVPVEGERAPVGAAVPPDHVPESPAAAGAVVDAGALVAGVVTPGVVDGDVVVPCVELDAAISRATAPAKSMSFIRDMFFSSRIGCGLSSER